MVVPSRQWTSASGRRALRAAVHLPGVRGAADAVAEPGEALGKTLGAVAAEGTHEGGDSVGGGREEEGTGGHGLGPGMPTRGMPS
ncbi:hypothetical protein [Streptomyces sp. NPDC059224]|uniref:hypothetical protein n=1 Tax=Streptomyces sp. NPDC059224 TaxID=3346775 RepID=UPI00369905A6